MHCGGGVWVGEDFIVVSHRAPTNVNDLSSHDHIRNYNNSVRRLWPRPLASLWRRLYPQLFDADDLRLSSTQPRNHFNEWFAAIHLFHRDGAHSLVEKYVHARHKKKVAQLPRIISKVKRVILDDIQAEFHVQLPDLLVFVPGIARFWFAEAKGPGDRLSAKQIQSHRAIIRRVGVPVEIIEVKVKR